MKLTRFQKDILITALQFEQPVSGYVLAGKRFPINVARQGMLDELAGEGFLSRHAGQGRSRFTYVATKKGRLIGPYLQRRDLDLRSAA